MSISLLYLLLVGVFFTADMVAAAVFGSRCRPLLGLWLALAWPVTAPLAIVLSAFVIKRFQLDQERLVARCDSNVETTP